jgi:hypothetical protein
MWRIVAVLVVTLAFGGALVYGGHAMGAWEEYKPVPDKAGTRLGGPLALSPKAAKAQRKRGAQARASRPRRRGLERWGARASAICRTARPDLELLAREMAAARSPEELEAALALIARANERVNAQLEAIPPPPRQRARVRALHGLLAKDERIVSRMVTAVRRRDGDALRNLVAAAEPVVKKENELFWVLGANECTVAAYLGDADALA